MYTTGLLWIKTFCAISLSLSHTHTHTRTHAHTHMSKFCTLWTMYKWWSLRYYDHITGLIISIVITPLLLIHFAKLSTETYRQAYIHKQNEEFLVYSYIERLYTETHIKKWVSSISNGLVYRWETVIHKWLL